jgi:predicted Zn-dependent protease
MRIGTATLPCALGLALVLAGCSDVTKVVTSAGVATGKISEDQAKSVNRSAEAVEKTFQDITPEQEYYIGRSVAATIYSSYKPFDQAAINQYLNVLGQTLALASEKPETFGGYHFYVMDTEEINAFAAPGGLILVSRGLIRCCRNEDALAGVLAHEIGHVEKLHGLKAIKKGRLTSALTTLAVEAGKNLGGEQLAEVTKAFEGTIGDITGTLVNSGYARELEFEADAAAVRILHRVGYNPQGLVDMLDQMQKKLKPGSHGFGSTHPTPKDRIEAVRKVIGSPDTLTDPPARKQRFTAAVARV